MEIPEDSEIRIGTNRYRAGRYSGYRKYGDTLLRIFFDSPREVVTVEGDEQVHDALIEIQAALTPIEKPGMWVEF